jgi:hypothetical protein
MYNVSQSTNRYNNMLIFALNAGGYYAVGTAVVTATDLESALTMANAASDPKLGLTYHGKMNPKPIDASSSLVACVLNIHEWGMPNLPSKGSGKKVTF